MLPRMPWPFARRFWTRSMPHSERAERFKGLLRMIRIEMNSARRLDQEWRSLVPQTPIVFVVDDDVSVRESLESLIRNAGWLAELFASGQEFLARPRRT